MSCGAGGTPAPSASSHSPPMTYPRHESPLRARALGRCLPRAVGCDAHGCVHGAVLASLGAVWLARGESGFGKLDLRQQQACPGRVQEHHVGKAGVRARAVLAHSHRRQSVNGL